MIDTILNTVFSIPYLIIGILIAGAIDLGIHYTKSSTRFTFIEILSCTLFWPIIAVVFTIGFIKGDN